jgi:ATP-binding cassette subfamily B protein
MLNTSSNSFFSRQVLPAVLKITLAMLICSIIGQLMEALSPWILGSLLQKLSVQDYSSATPWFLGLVGAWILAALFPIVYQGLDSRVAPRLFQLTQETLFDRLLRQPHTYFETRSAGELGQYVRQAAQAAVSLHNILFFDISRILVLLGVTLVLIVPVQATLAFVFLAWVVLYMLLSFKISNSCVDKAKTQSVRGSQTMSRLVDVISNLEIVRFYQGIRFEKEALGTVLGNERQAQSDLRSYLTKMNLFQAASKLIISIGVVVAAYLQLRAGHIHLGDFVMFIQLSLLVAVQVQNISNRLVDGFNQLGALNQSLTAIPEPQARAVALKKMAKMRPGSLEFANVSFTYPNGRQVLKDVSFQIQTGEKVAIVGPSGSGKSTIFRLLTAQYQASSGQVLVGGQDLNSLNADELFSNLTIVPQVPRVFHRSLAENLSYGTQASELESAAILASLGASDLVQKLPGGLQTSLGDHGLLLSGGERQRICVARALLRQAPILLLDEATSALDARSREQMLWALTTHNAGKILVSITHRLEGLAEMDRIIYLHEGQIAESGTHAELVARQGLYYQALNATAVEEGEGR